MKKYYQVNTVNGAVKPVTKNAVEKKLYARDFITWYEDDEYIFIADCTEDELTVENIVRKKLKVLGKPFDVECFTQAYLM